MEYPDSTIRVAAIQAEAIPGDVAGNAAVAARLADGAADEGARLAVLPELFLPAYHPPSLADPSVDVAADVGRRVADPRLSPLRRVARERGVVLIVGAAVRHADARRTLSALVVDRSGEVTAAYDKQNLWGDDEKRLFIAGTAGATVTVDGWRLGLGICYDGCFPEHGRAAARAGVHGYLVPAGYLTGSQHRRDLYYAARALDNTMYVVFANAIGGEPPFVFNGGAAVYDAEGRTLGRGPDDGEAIVVADLDPEALAATRRAHTMLADVSEGASEPRLEMVA